MKFDKKTQLTVIYIVLTLFLFLLVQNYFSPQVESLSYSRFRQLIAEQGVTGVTIGTELIHGQYRLQGVEKSFVTSKVEDPDLIRLLSENDVEFDGAKENTWLHHLLGWVVPAVIFVGIWMFMARRLGGGSGGLMSIGKSKAKVYMEKGTGITFGDVAGIDEAKEELQEIVEFLETPGRFQALGGKIPHGVLLVGPPGTGKTLLAKAVAGEADVPFFSISGSDFVEMFVGVGAARVRDLFEQAKKHAPAIVFIDELDALGKARGAGSFGGHDEREQTLNQLLTELDGFESNGGVILMAATNRPEILDRALLRPGRFDRTVMVDRPDVKGREAILKIHARDAKLAPQVDLHRLAVRTPGFAGADLANLINEAALLAARRNKNSITMDELDEAIERAVIGLARKSRVISDKERKVIAYHEAGHAIVGELLEHADPVLKITIVSRGMAGGYVLSLPVEDRYISSQSEFKDSLCSALAGRAAEKVIFKESWDGVYSDLQQATRIAESMVKEFGMSERIGLVSHTEERRQEFLGMGGKTRDYSEETAQAIDEEIRMLMNEAYGRAEKIIKDHRGFMDELVDILLEKETMEGDEFRQILKDFRDKNSLSQASSGAPQSDERQGGEEGKAQNGSTSLNKSEATHPPVEKEEDQAGPSEGTERV